MIDWSKYPNFTEKEFRCKHTGQCHVSEKLLDALQAVRDEYGKPMVVTSGYRDKSHPEEAKKLQPGQHSLGLAVDLACEGSQAHEIVRLAMKHGFRGIGVSQKTTGPRFIHLDMRAGRPVIYSY